MEYLQRLLDKIDRFELLISGLGGAVIASWWHKDDLNDWRAWMIFLITGMACSIYLTSMVSTYLGVTEPKIVAGIGKAHRFRIVRFKVIGQRFTIQLGCSHQLGLRRSCSGRPAQPLPGQREVTHRDISVRALV
ncbi:hypothetical protein ACI77I_31985 [Pseudomonas sp. D47]|uniref:hypothetical protein n=1 Tax=Pseudomonas sp. D47 TaxID=3159447 RepID=UPI00387B2170